MEEIKYVSRMRAAARGLAGAVIALPELTGGELLSQALFSTQCRRFQEYAMVRERILECTFLIPIYGDRDLSDGEQHRANEWEWLADNTWLLFGGGTRAPGLYEGFYKDPDSGNRVNDQSRKFIVAVPKRRLNDLRNFLAEACMVFHQKCLYLSIAGEVEFIEPPEK